MNQNPLKNNEAFGKLEVRDGEIIAWHPLIDHMIDVASCFIRLSECAAIHRSLENLASRKLMKQDILRLAVLAFLHDLGKANSGFQAKRWQEKQHIPSDWPVPVHAGHCREVYTLLDSELARVIEPLISQICSWGDAADALFIASISHHGRPLKDGGNATGKGIWQKSNRTYAPDKVLDKISKAVVALYPEAFDSSIQELPSEPAFTHYFAGLIQLADWIGSDTRFFKFSETGENRTTIALASANKAIKTIGLDVESWRNHLLQTSLSFERAFDGFSMRPIQATMSNADLNPLVILESETGSGKTEAALWRYLQLFQAGKVDSLYFALPTRVAATQLYGRIRIIAERVWPDSSPVVLRALPGYVAADGSEARFLPDFEVQWNDDPKEQQAHKRWAGENAKRFLTAPIAVGTIDQALLGILPISHAHLRFAALSRSLLVVDEVHASDAYMGKLLEQLLTAHLKCGGHSLLLSATLGASARERYLSLTREIPAGKRKTMSFDQALNVPYPAVSDSHKTRPVQAISKPKQVSWKTWDKINSPDEIANLAAAAANAGAKVLVIRNTVPAAIATLQAIEKIVDDISQLFQVNGTVTLHHGRFSRQDRPTMDDAVQAQMGKGRKSSPLILVGTQTLEQSLDIDADFLITDLCPMDVLLQRIGRLHRHDNARPEEYRDAQTVVLTPENNNLSPMLKRANHGLGRFNNGGGIYDDLRIIEATCRQIIEKPQISIPADNRLLVEASTHWQQLEALAEELGQAWQKLGAEIKGDIGARETFARIQGMNFDTVFGEEEFNGDEEVATRLGAKDRLVEFDPPIAGPFGIPVKSIPIRHHMISPKDLSFDAQASEVIAGEGIITFQFGNNAYRYSRLGLEVIKD